MSLNMRCQVTRCGNSAEETLEIAIGYKWGDGARMPNTKDKQTVTICKMHYELLSQGKLKPKH